MIRLVFVMVYFSVFIRGIASGPITRTGCRAQDKCILLRDCKSYMNFIDSLEKPLNPPVVEFLREKQCGFHEGYPKVCCSDSSKKDAIVTPPKASFKTCKTKRECIPLKECRYYTDLIKTTEKPLKPVFVEFLRAQQCGFEDGYPTVCCSLLPKTFKVPVQNSRKQNKLSSLELEVKDVFNRNKTTAKPANSTRKKKSKKSSLDINKFDLADLLDLTIPFDLFRRRRSLNDLQDTEIR